MLSEETDDNEMGEEEEEEKGDDGIPGTDDGGGPETVNYGYHPIIDFFDKYRFASNR